MAKYQGHAGEIVTNLDWREKEKQKKFDEVVSVIAGELSVYIRGKASANSGLMKFTTDDKRDYLEHLEVAYGMKSVDDCIVLIAEAREKMQMPPMDSKLLLQKKVMQIIAEAIVDDYNRAVQFREFKKTKPDAIAFSIYTANVPTYAEIAGCMNEVEKELGITCKQAMNGKDIIRYLESELTNDKEKGGRG